MKPTDPWQSNKTKGAGEGREVFKPTSFPGSLFRPGAREREREKRKGLETGCIADIRLSVGTQK